MRHAALYWRNRVRKSEGATACRQFCRVRLFPLRFGTVHRTLLFRCRRDTPRKSIRENFPHSTDPLPTIQRSLRTARSLSFLRLLDGNLDRLDLVMLCIVARVTRYDYRFNDVRVNKVPVTSFAPAVHEARPFELGNEFFLLSVVSVRLWLSLA